MSTPTRPRLSRRRLLRTAAAAAGAVTFPAPWGPALAALDGAGRPVHGYGPLSRHPARLLDLPEGFSARVVSRMGDRMSDGLQVPARADGMHAFAGPDGATVLVRNHELDLGDPRHAFAARRSVSPVLLDRLYDRGAGPGGVTTVVLDAAGNVQRQLLSLGGTVRNCAGGATPWGSWLSCEESVVRAGHRGAVRSHGYAFEVRASARTLERALPLTAMGRFHREAVAVDPVSGVVYQTEDRVDGLLYRFVPDVPGKLARGGRLEALALAGFEGADTGNRGGPEVPARRALPVRWVALDRPDAPDDDLRERGRAAGASTFVRGEGMAVDRDRSATRIWFKCTSGGANGHGQLWCYRPSPREATAGEAMAPGTLELFLEPQRASLMDQGDNLAVAPNGDLLVCEDNAGLQRVLGVTPDGGVYTVARNPRGDSEFAGATFAPGGKVMFVNLQVPGLTLALTGPWQARSDAPEAS